MKFQCPSSGGEKEKEKEKKIGKISATQTKRDFSCSSTYMGFCKFLLYQFKRSDLILTVLCILRMYFLKRVFGGVHWTWQACRGGRRALWGCTLILKRLRFRLPCSFHLFSYNFSIFWCFVELICRISPRCTQESDIEEPNRCNSVNSIKSLDQKISSCKLWKKYAKILDKKGMNY